MLLRAVALPRHLRLLGFDLANCILNRIEYEERRGMPGLIVPYGLEHRKIRPSAFWRRTALFQHLAHRGSDGAKLRGARPHDFASHYRRRGLAQETGLDALSIVRDPIAAHRKVDGHPA